MNPDLAESWEIAPDNKSITFHLREGATFASGNPVTAADVVWSLNRLMTLNLAQASFLKTHGFSAENVPRASPRRTSAPSSSRCRSRSIRR